MPDTVISSRLVPSGTEPSSLVPLDQIDLKVEASPRHRAGAYDNAFAPDNVYGHALDLLSRHRVDAQGALHIDIGSGFGRIAEPLVEALGLTYLGCDLDEDALASLERRGFETHRLVLDTEARIYHALTAIIGGRRLASISIIDTLEHLDDPAAAMRALSRISSAYQAFILISVPNTAHRDLGMRMMFGLWDYTETGILDYTHRCLFSDSVLRRMLGRSGLHVIDANDVKMAVSDQAFPTDHPALQTGTTLHRLLCGLRDLGDDFGSTNQLVRLCTAGPAAALPEFDDRRALPRPLLSVVIRSEGRQPDLLAEIMTCLAGQTVTDFEILILGHRLDRPRQVSIEQVIFELPDWLRRKIRFLRIERGNRTDLLNDGFAAAVGRYISVLEESDIVFAHWAEGFSSAVERAPGRILQYVAGRQAIRRVEYNFAIGIRAESGIIEHDRTRFDLFEHMPADSSPLPGIAFPRGLSHHLKFGFDPALQIFAGWDYFLRGAALVGITPSPVITAIHRRLGRVEHKAHIERSNVAEKFNRLSMVLWPATTEKNRDPPDALARLRDRSADAEKAASDARREAADLKLRIAAISVEAAAKSIEIANVMDDFEEYRHVLRDVSAIYSSASWRLAAPMRLLTRLFGSPPTRKEAVLSLSTAQLYALRQQLRASRSWRITRKLRGGFSVRSRVSLQPPV